MLNILAWLPLLVLPIMAEAGTSRCSAWVGMWGLAVAIYLGLKWLTFAVYSTTNSVSFGRAVGYLVFWAGMNAPAFCSTANRVAFPKAWELLVGLVNFIFGLLLMQTAVGLVQSHPTLGGWIGMAGIVFMIHFGIVRALSFAWRKAGVDAQPIMNAPILASSLSDFWSKRWNLAFRDVAHAHVFRPVVKHLGVACATLMVFLASGIVHDVVISGAANAGYGFPTLYFMIQGIAILFERSKYGKRMGINDAAIGRFFAAIIVLGPVGLLFHQPFIHIVVVPMFKALGNFEAAS